MFQPFLEASPGVGEAGCAAMLEARVRPESLIEARFFEAILE
jgi:hypothetical protein